MASQGLGKTLFRGFTKTVNQIHKSFIKGFNQGYGLDRDSYESAMEQALFNYYAEMANNDAPNIELWTDRAQEFIEEKAEYMRETYPSLFDPDEMVEDVEDYDDIDPTEEDDDSREYAGDESQDGGFIDVGGRTYPIITPEDQAFMRARGNQRRKTIVPTIEELIDYVEGVPYIVGVELVYEGGYFEGYVVWIEYN